MQKRNVKRMLQKAKSKNLVFDADGNLQSYDLGSENILIALLYSNDTYLFKILLQTTHTLRVPRSRNNFDSIKDFNELVEETAKSVMSGKFTGKDLVRDLQSWVSIISSDLLFYIKFCRLFHFF